MTLAAYAAPWPGDQIDIADTYLRPLANTKKGSRAAFGFIGMAVSAGFLLHGAGLMSEKDQLRNGTAAGAIYLGSGMMMAVISAYELATPSKAEKAYDTVKQIDDLAYRNSEALAAMENMAESAKRSRVTTGIACAVFGVVQLTAFKNDETEGGKTTANVLAGVDFAFSLLSFAIKSSEERALRKFDRDSAGSLGFAFVPYFGGGTVGLASTFSF